MLWACRISVISAMGGYLLFALVIQAQDLFADTTLGHIWWKHILFWSFVFASTFVVWAFPVHYAARKVLSEEGKDWFFPRRELLLYSREERRTQFLTFASDRDLCMITWIPRMLGVIPFLATLIGIFGSILETAHATSLVPGLQLQYWFLIFGDLVSLILFLIFVIYRRTLLEPHYRHIVEAIRFEWISIVVTFLILLALYIWPLVTTDWLKRAAMIPYLFGSGVLLFSELARLSHRLAQPIIAYILVVLTGATALNWRFNAIRVLAHTAEVEKKVHLQERQIGFGEAVRLWRDANKCSVTGSLGSPEDDAAVAKCPPAMIVAAEGGASRAAYFTASALGEFLDKAKDIHLDNEGPEDHANPARRIFAMSGVSGGSLGVAAIKAALVESDGKPPCRTLGNPTWRTCLERLVDGDYLSPIFVGLGFRDNFAPPFPPFTDAEIWGDRAALLERAWERHFLAETDPSGKRYCTDQTDFRGFCRPFGYPKESPRWAPLLLLNGTSVQTGRRIIASELVSTRGDPGNPDTQTPLYQWAYDAFEMMSVPCPNENFVAKTCASRGPPVGSDASPDIRLSTAALISARFPIISPAGAIWMKDETHGDTVVDGGYFENSGLTSALDIATALNEFKVRPIIVSISNEPRREVKTNPDPRHIPLLQDRFGSGPAVDVSKWTFFARAFGTLYAPTASLFNTRSGHADEEGGLAARTLQSWNVPPGVKQDADQYASIFPLQVFAEPKISGQDFEMQGLSMSWWLSPVVQADLDKQVNDERNQQQFKLLVRRLSAPGMPCPQHDVLPAGTPCTPQP
jgi:hypothetical protein